MPRTWYATGLSVDPPSLEIGDTWVEPLVFDAEQAVTDCSAVLTNLRSGVVVAASPSGDDDDDDTDDGLSVVLVTPLATVNVNAPTAGLVRGNSYELEVIWTNAAGRTWSRTLVLVVVA